VIIMRVENTKLYHLYFFELFWLASGIIKNCENIFEEARLPDSGSHFMQISPEIHERIVNVLMNSANIKKFLKKPKKQKNRFSKFKKQRSSILWSALKGIKLNEILKNRVRNSLEHFDNYLDKTNIKFNDVSPTEPMAAYNMIFSDWDVTTPRVYPVRLYIANERKFYNLEGSADIGKIYEEAQDIICCLRKTNIIPEDDGPCGLMVRLT